MVKFDSLELIGFKSFAEKTRVVFHDKVSAIVGPNGCGKSNLSDAIAWVLGVQSARNLRGQTMEDVIFNGTSTRKPSGYGEVRLTLRRSGEQPLLVDGQEISGDTLELSRKFYRSGEGVYLINQRRCRLKDIQQVLEEAGLGFASYAVIAQGRIESFLSAKPLERRVVIEEAAGIVGYKSRRKNAELKLEMSQQNLLRVNDIILEVERQLRSLKRQASRAKRYREIRDEFRLAQLHKFILEYRQLRERWGALDTQLQALTRQEDELRRELETSEQVYRSSLQERDRQEQALAEVRQRRSELHLQSTRAENAIQYHQDQIDNTRRQLAAYSEEQESIRSSLEKIAQEMSQFDEEREELAAQEQEAEAAFQQQSKLVDQCRAELTAADREIERLQQELVRSAGELVSLRNGHEQAQSRQQLLLSSRARLEQEKAGHLSRRESLQEQLGEAEQEAARRRLQQEELRERLAAEQATRRDWESRLELLNQELQEKQSQLIAARERLQSLQEVEINHSQYSEGVKKFLNHLAQDRTVRAGGTLADFIETSPEYERLVEEFLSDELEYVLVDTLDEAVKGSLQVKSLKSGKCTFLTLHSSNGFGKNGGQPLELPAAPSEGVHGTLGSLISIKPEVQEAFRRVLPQRAQAIVVSDLDRAFHLAHSYPESTFVTLEGEALTPRGLLSVSAAQARKIGLLSLKRQKRELEKKLSETQIQAAALQQEKESQEARLSELLVSQRAHEEEIHRLEKEAIGLAHSLEQCRLEIHRESRALSLLEEEERRMEKEREELKEKLLRLEGALDERSAAQAEIEARLSQNRAASQQLRQEFSRMQEQMHALSSERKLIAERRQALSRTLERIGEQKRELEVRRQNSLESSHSGKAKLEDLAEALARTGQTLEELRIQSAALDEELGARQSQYEEWKTSHPARETALNQIRSRREELQRSRGQLEVERARVDIQLQTAQQQCAESLEVDLAECSGQADLEGLVLDEVSARYAELKNTLDQYGPINMTALEEYQENEERFQYLSRQRQDIEQSIADTTKAIQEINRRSREKFKVAFEAINRHFKDVFQRLFGGGECGMQLLDEEDLLESGIDINAQPPGKKLQNVMLLSGGEKAMTVLALLVAIFTFKPSQFCVMDEVDAPLDDANVKRFTQLIQEMSSQTQFILITHNKKTMEIADLLYGVTMDDPGVSQVVSVQL